MISRHLVKMYIPNMAYLFTVPICIVVLFGLCRRRETIGQHRSIDGKYEDPVLLPRHKIFLSHSGAQKEFVEQLCVDLERRHRFPFFDKRPSSLPKGERFPNLIKEAVARCEMMVVVVSEEYFSSKWPMIELNGFMQATKKDKNLKILLLFYGLYVEEFFDSCRHKKWFKKWESMAKADHRIKVAEWKESLNLLGAFNGLVYERHSKEVVAYRQEIVSNICKAIPPDIKYDESHVQGRSKLCEVIRGYFESTPYSTKIPGVRVIGLYGLGGMGKTEICKMMCNEMDGEFDGKVCHVELGNQNEHELVHEMLTTLTNTSAEVVQEVGNGKCRDVLLNKMHWKQKSFLTIDNIWDDFDSLDQGKLFLKAPFVEGSWVIITSRLKKTLISCNVDEKACFEMPELDKDDARKMFLYYATHGKEFENTEDVYAIEECIDNCYFRKGEGRGSQYHPLSLKALGVFLQYGGKEPSMWMKNLQELKESSYSQKPVNCLFKILRINFDRLPEWEQELFMDVAMFFPPSSTKFKPDLMEWLCLVHKKEKNVIENGLGHLVDSALLEHVEMSSGKVSIHDLYREFAILEAQGKLKDLDMKKRRWVYAKDALPTELEDEWSSWKMLTRVCISEIAWITSLRVIKWKRCMKLAVLKLDDLSELSGNLNLKDLIRLRSLTVEIGGFSPLKVSIEGLKGLKSLTYFKLVCGCGEPGANVGQLPAALKVLEVDATVVFKRDVLALCTNLVSLKLESVYTSDLELDLKSCTSLRKVELIKNQGLKNLKLGPSLQSLNISHCSNLVEVCGLDRLVDLLSLVLIGNQKLSTLPSLTGLKRLQTLICVGLDIDEVPGLDSLVGLKSLTLSSCGRLSKLPSLTGLQCLRKLNINMLRITEIPNLRGLEQLEDIFLSGTKILKLPSLTGLKRLHKLICIDLDILEVPGLEGLVGLKSLTLKGCRRLSKLPSLTALECLRELDILELGITEIPNLSGLEQLQVIDASKNSQLTTLQGLGDLRALKTIDLSRCESLCRLSDMSKLTNLKVLDLRFTGVELHEEDIHMLEGLQVLEPVLVASPSEDRNDRDVSTYGLDFKKRKIMYLKSEPFYDYEGWQISYKSGWEEKGLHCPVGRCIEIRDVKNIWRISGRAVKFPGTDAGCISRR